MKHTVVMPTFKRPEMLALALEALDRTNADCDVRIFLDHTTPERVSEVEYVRDLYYPDALIFHAKPHIVVPAGMWNILNALKQGYKTGADYVYLVEEDVVVKPGFFQWHQEAQASGDYLATCGRRIPYLPEYNQYTNPGSCFRRDKLELVVKHITDELFANRRAYYEKHFGMMDEVSDLDDGLVRRIAKFYGLKVKYPDMPTCAHKGFQAYNHYYDWTNHGDIVQRIENLRKMLPTVSRENRFTKDFEPD